MAKRKYAIFVGADPNRFDNVEFNSEYSAKLSLAALKVELNRQVQVVELVEVKHEKISLDFSLVKLLRKPRLVQTQNSAKQNVNIFLIAITHYM